MKRQENELGKPAARSAKLVTESFDDGRVVYDERTHAAHSLRSDVAAVWDLCDGRRTPEEIASSLRLDPELVQCALYELEVCDLLEPEELPAVSGIGGLRLDRRSMLKRTAMVGGGVALISSVFVPSAFAFGSDNVTLTVTGTVGATLTAKSTQTVGTSASNSQTVAYPGTGSNSVYCSQAGYITVGIPQSVVPNTVEFDYGNNSNNPEIAVINQLNSGSVGVTVVSGSTNGTYTLATKGASTGALPVSGALTVTIH